MEKNQPNQLYVNSISCCCWLLILAADQLKVDLQQVSLVQKSLLSAFLAAFVTVAIYKVVWRTMLLFRMPDEEVPPKYLTSF